MLDMGFLPEIRKILKYVPRKRQTLFFSATMPPQIREAVAGEMLHAPTMIQRERRRSRRSASSRPSTRSVRT